MDDCSETSLRGRAIVLIGAPSAAGKTWLSRSAMDGNVPFLSEVCREYKSATRTDIKALPAEFAPDQAHFVECSIHRFDRVSASEQWRRLTKAVESCDRVVHVTLAVPRMLLAKQYLRRILSGPQRMSPIRRVLTLSRYRSLFTYLFTNRLARGYAQWESFGRQIQSAAPAKVALLRVERATDGYVISSHSRPAREHGQTNLSTKPSAERVTGAGGGKRSSPPASVVRPDLGM